LVTVQHSTISETADSYSFYLQLLRLLRSSLQAYKKYELVVKEFYFAVFAFF